jgi:hypothetical protein
LTKLTWLYPTQPTCPGPKKKEKKKKTKPIKRKSFVSRSYKNWREKEPP